MSEKDQYITTTVAVAQTILDCATHAQNDSQMVQAAAQHAGLYPLKPKDRRILLNGMGAERLERFEKLCRRER